MKREVQKIFRLETGELVGGSGSANEILEVIQWYKDGCQTDKYPACQRSDNGGSPLIVVKDGKVVTYASTPFPIPLLERFDAWGSGRDYAIAAMHLGKTAAEAVAISSLFDIHTGMGVDSFE